MPFDVLCPWCGMMGKAPDQTAGKKVKCPRCKGEFLASPGAPAEAGPSVVPPEAGAYGAPRLELDAPAGPGPASPVEPIVLQCGNGHYLKAPASLAGKRVRCPKPGCQLVVSVPIAPSSSAPDAAPNQADRLARPALAREAFTADGATTPPLPWDQSSAPDPAFTERMGALGATPAELEDQSDVEPESLLQGRWLSQWEMKALRSYPAVKQLRSHMILLWILLVVNTLINMAALAQQQRPDDVELLAIVATLFGFIIVLALSLITFFRPTQGWALATAISIFPFACGCITFIMACSILGSLRQLREASMSSDQFGRLKHALRSLFDGLVPDTLPCRGKVGWFSRPQMSLKLFDNAALFVTGRKGVPIMLRRGLAADRPLVPAKHGYRLCHWRKEDGAPFSEVLFNEEVADQWRRWAAK